MVGAVPAAILVRSPTGFSSTVTVPVVPPARPLTRVCKRDSWGEAASTVVVIVRDAAFAVLVAWAMTWVSAAGNIFSGRAVRDQSYDEFFFATLFWIQQFYCFTGTWMQAATLLRRRFLSRPDTYPTLVHCFVRVARRGLVYYAVVVGVWALLALSFSKWEPSVRIRQIKLEFYMYLVGCFVYTVGLGIIGRHIFRFETVEGVDQQQHREPTDSGPAASIAKQGGSIRTSIAEHLMLVMRFSIVRLPMMLCVQLTSMYAQVMKSQHLKVSSDIYVVTFACMALKISVQEIAKRAMLRKNVKHVRTMFLSVAMPTVLIDTQLRVVLQRLKSTQLTITGTALMAACEVAMRIVKTMLVRLECRRLDSRWKRRSSVAPLAGGRSVGVSRGQVEAIKTKLMAFHSAELFSDMLAEYIAMGCSTAALFFYWEHPKYRLGELHALKDVDAGAVSSQNWTQHQSLLLTAQVCVEILVDMASCVVELSLGVSFHEIRRHGTYLVSLSVMLAVVNTFVTAAIYIQSD
ncbi:hypothetical protein P43SY_003334 [Pythium insidiosum]|uniref:Transmembrane protein n=1 Tax=Pythium insidiosum TaxID=114742 RepID=A0AAD5Q6K1_PYTIN|nr:hypothetical protein P43SY_003334 [Pythium insidiosum]